MDDMYILNERKRILYSKHWVPLLKRCYERDLLIESSSLDAFYFSIFHELFKQYNEKHRKYHNTKHIFDLLETHNYIYYKQGLVELNDPEAIEFAIFFHDSIYETNLDEYIYNEQRSSEYVRFQLHQINFDQDFSNLVHDYIMYSDDCVVRNQDMITEKSNEFINDICYLHDLDFSYLGKDFNTFMRISKQIKKEFGWFFRTFRFNGKRKRFLTSLLNQDSIFKTKYFIDNYEDQARKNITKVISLY